jgi:hypothetical protein
MLEQGWLPLPSERATGAMSDKALEKWYLKQLQAALDGFPHGDPQPGESPDFIVPSENGAIGVEITVFHLPPPAPKRPHQEVQRLKDSVVETARRMHAAAGGPPLRVSVYFSQPVRITKRNATKVGEALAAAVGSSPISPPDEAVRILWQHLPPGIADVTIRDARGHEVWFADAGGLVASVEPEHIDAVIRRKHAMLRVARAKCSEVWLVIVNDLVSRAAPAELSDAATAHFYQYEFDRLFWLEANTPMVHEFARAHGEGPLSSA